MLLFGKAVAIGIAVAAPIGPVAILCFRRSIERGWRAGVATAFGAATADAIHAAIAVFGLAAALGAFTTDRPWVETVVGGVLILLGVHIALRRPSAPHLRHARPTAHRYLRDIVSAFVLMGWNPLTPFVFAALFAGIGLVGFEAGTRLDNLSLAGAAIAGVFVGTALWFIALTWMAVVLRARLEPRTVRWINRVSGTAVAGFGLYLLLM